MFLFSKKGDIIVQGDYNVRTGDIQETVLDDDNAFRNVPEDQPPPQALRFSHGRGERETRVTGDEPQGTIPAFLCAHIFIKRETSGYEAA